MRSIEEFNGQFELDERRGHMPGARNIEWQQFIGDNHSFLDTDENIRHNLSKTGISHTVPVITYCRVGMRGAIGYIALQRIGYDVRLYDGSYSEWQSSGLPVET